jgi:branched-subunit amino acid aminotransferase/4-amino-4-deoxychorismate lyase
MANKAVALDVDSRGLNYGDGLFETILIEQRSSRFGGVNTLLACDRGAQVLGMQLPDPDGLLGEICANCRRGMRVRC